MGHGARRTADLAGVNTPTHWHFPSALYRGFPAAGDDEVDAAGHSYDADDGRHGDGVLGVCLDMGGAEVHDGVPLGVRDALVNEGGNAKDDEEHSS